MDRAIRNYQLALYFVHCNKIKRGEKGLCPSVRIAVWNMAHAIVGTEIEGGKERTLPRIVDANNAVSIP